MINRYSHYQDTTGREVNEPLRDDRVMFDAERWRAG